MANQDLALLIQKGVPFVSKFTFASATTTWPTLSLCEARSQLRRTATSATLIFDFTPYLTTSISGTDIVVTLTMNGSQTRLVTSSGLWDLFLSDVGTTDANSMRLGGNVIVNEAVTSP